MDKMFKTRYEVAKSDNVDLKREIYNPKTFYPDDPNLSDEDKRLVERTYYLFKVDRKLLKTFADNSKCKRQLYVHKTNIQIYMDNTVGIGEHIDIVETVDKELVKLCEAEDKLATLINNFSTKDI